MFRAGLVEPDLPVVDPWEEYYREYWESRGEGYVPPAVDMRLPVQSFSWPGRLCNMEADGLVHGDSDSARFCGAHDHDEDGYYDQPPIGDPGTPEVMVQKDETVKATG